MATLHRNDKENYRSAALQAAKDLCYGKEVEKKIKEAKTDAEIEKIMVNARKGNR